MRLTCPSCNAQYEVDDAVIPRAGRDVQCSACGNTWFQYPREIALQMREADLDDDDDDDIEIDHEHEDESSETAGIAAALRDPDRKQRIDKKVLDVLREEADREMEERRRANSGIETQGDLGLSRPTRSKAAPQPIYGEDDPEEPDLPPLEDDIDDDQPEQAPKNRRNLLPNIEELSSTLAPGGEARELTEDLPEAAASGGNAGFGKGITFVLLIALACVLVYIFAPLIANLVPALRGALITYVGLIDSARESVGGLLRGLLNG